MKEADDLYAQLQKMYEFMQESGATEDIEKAIFEYEDCVSEDEYSSWLKKYEYYK